MGAPTWKLSTRAGSQGGSRRHTAHQACPGLPPGDQPGPARPTDTASHQARGRGHTHPEAWVQGRGSEAGPLSAPCPGLLPTPLGSQSRPAHSLPAGAPPRAPCLTQGTCPTPGDKPAMLSARSQEAWGTHGPTAAGALEQQPWGPCSRLSTQPASPRVIFLPQQMAESRRFLGN